MNKKILVGGTIILLMAIATLVVLTQNENDTQLSKGESQNQPNTNNIAGETKQEPAPTKQIEPKLSAGRYTQYSAQNRADSSYNRTIIFFHAPWCPQCRAFENNLSGATLPDGTQILKTDYDSSTDLKKQYGVTLQTTFVLVDANGNQIKKWVGYSSDHSLNSVLEQFKT